ncbi:MAG: hypothetical protein SV862_00120 [Pseudomonadota bacterium]|nr:hypothetical protein [Pseudomonadota bacterium]
MDPAWVFAAFGVILAAVIAIGTPFRGAPRRSDQPGAAPQPAQTGQTAHINNMGGKPGSPITQGGQTFYPPPPPGHRYVIGADGKMKAVRG